LKGKRVSNLTVALAVLGVLVLAALAAHGAWAARKASEKRPVTMAARPEPVEPVFTEPDQGDSGAGRDGPVLGPASGDRITLKRQAARIDPLIDAVVTLAVEAPVSGEHLLLHLPATRRAGSKPFLIEALNAASAEWEPPAAAQLYSELQAGVQLTNRNGAINEIEYSEFVQTLQTFADAIGAMADFPDMLDVVARGRELDAFAGQHDAQLAVHLHARSAVWSVAYVLQHAARHGFVPGAVPGRLVLPGGEDGAPAVITLSFDSQAALDDDPQRSVVRDVTLSFDVPQTDPRFEPYVAWQASAQALSLGMDAAIVDDQGHAITEAGFAGIGDELEHLYASLRARDLAAGSPAARRLFS
jgi:hypothetical protein